MKNLGRLAYVGGVNESAIPDGETGKIEIKHELNSTFMAKGLILRYKSGQEYAEIKIEEASDDRRFSFGRVQICTVGHEKNAHVGPPAMAINSEITPNSTFLVHIFNKTGATINPGDIAATAVGNFKG